MAGGVETDRVSTPLLVFSRCRRRLGPASTLALLAVLILVEGEVGTSTNTPQDTSAYPASGDQYST